MSTLTRIWSITSKTRLRDLIPNDPDCKTWVVLNMNLGSGANDLLIGDETNQLHAIANNVGYSFEFDFWKADVYFNSDGCDLIIGALT